MKASSIPILHFALRTERDVVQVRQKAREVAAALRLDNQDQIRMATATSEMARNAFRYALSGKVSFAVCLEPPQRFQIVVTDSGPGISNLDEIYAGRYKSETGMGMGIAGTRRLMDEFQISTSAGGTTVSMAKYMPPSVANWSPRFIEEIKRKMQQPLLDDPYTEIELQNRELLNTLQELRLRHEELELLNRELEDTNRGVVALYAELDERADYLRRASELKTKFLSNVSHEFRTPLNSIISLSRLLMDRIDGDLTSEQFKQIRYIESSARDLQEMVNDLLDLAKVEAGKIRIRTKRFEVHELFSALKGMLKPLLTDNNSLDLVFEDVRDICPLHTDEGKISQILRNLISNALKFTPEGSVTVSAHAVSDQLVRFSVADTGIGIPPEHRETIFKEFSQIDNPLQEKHRGTGLGLPLCRNLAMLLGGQITLESEPGRGSTFFLTVPTVYAGESVDRDEALNIPAPEFNRSPVLYLEDDPRSAQFFQSVLRETEFQPILASSIEQAGGWVDRHKPAAVLIDVYIGEEASWDFIERVKNAYPDVPVIATSAYASASEPQAKIDLFLLKPLDRETLLAQLRTLTRNTGTRKLLLVDDNEVSRYIVRELLSQPWLQMEEFSNGATALARIEQQLPDAMILDLLMPDVSGFDVLRELRSKPHTLQLPVLVYTSKPLSQSERKQLADWNAPVVRKEDVSSRLSTKPFLDWLRAAGLTPEARAQEQNA